MNGYVGFKPLEVVCSGIPRGTSPTAPAAGAFAPPPPIAKPIAPAASMIPSGLQSPKPHALPTVPQWSDDTAVGWDDAFSRGSPTIDTVIKALGTKADE